MEDSPILLIPDRITECALHIESGVCSSLPVVEKMSEIIGVTSADPQDIVAEAKTTLGCPTEKCVLEKMASQLGKDIVAREIAENFKVGGPTDSALLDNRSIDNLMKQWMVPFPDFFAYNFNMRDYATNSPFGGTTPDTLATIKIVDLLDKYTTAGCIINSDVAAGRGKHWMALFVDARGRDFTAEFFNSSGNPPAAEWVNWLTKTVNAAKSTGRFASCKAVRVSRVRHQDSKSECGVYSLFYIYARLSGVPASAFSQKIPDKYMFEFRQHVFVDPSRPAIKVFDWAAYQKTVAIKWWSTGANEKD